MLIKILNPADLSVKGVLNKFTSLQHTTKIFANGNFELHTTEDLIDVNDVILFESYGQTFGGIVLKKTQTRNDIALVGCDWKGMMSFRYNIYPDHESNTATYAAMIYHYLNRNFNDRNRTVTYVELNIEGKPGEDYEGNFTYSTGYVDELVNTISEKKGIGITCSYHLNTNKISFDRYDGILRTGLVFSERYKSSINDEFTDDMTNSYTCAYQDIDEDFSGFWVGDLSLTGLSRKETYSSERTVPGLYPSILENSQRAQFITLQPTDKFQFGTDFLLGDFITAEFNGNRITEQITEVEQVYEHSNRLINLTLGKAKINPFSKLIRKG